jgi:hypothetical protein
MSWKEADSQIGGFPPLAFESDGETRRIVVVSEPSVVVFSAFGQERRRAVFNVVCDGELYRWFVSPKVFAAVRELRPKLATCALEVTRHGAPKDINTKYEIAAVKLTKDELKAVAELAAKADEGKGEGGKVPF